MEAVFLAFVLMLSIFLGFELISKVPATLHTPLMSGVNAISGITLVMKALAMSRARPLPSFCFCSFHQHMRLQKCRWTTSAAGWPTCRRLVSKVPMLRDRTGTAVAQMLR